MISANLIEECLPLVGVVVDKVKERVPTHINRDDLYSAGIDGLLSAANKYREGLGRFQTYAYVRIRGSVLDTLRKMDTCTRRGRQTYNKVETARMKLEQTFRMPASYEQAIVYLGWNAERSYRFKAVLRSILDTAKFVELDHAPEHLQEQGLCPCEKIADPSAVNPADQVSDQEMLDELKFLVMDCLNEKEQTVIRAHYAEDKKFPEIARSMGLSDSRISQIHTQAILRLRKLMWE